MLNSFWSVFSIILIVASILGCWWLLHWTKGISDREEDDDIHDTGHVWDYDIRELNNPLPRWWLNLFNITIVFAIVYLALYPGLGNLAGYLGWTQEGQYEEEVAASERLTAEIFTLYRSMELPELMQDADAMATGRRLFGQNCAMCHGSGGQGGTGFPNLTDEVWQWGSGYDNVLTAITHGRNAAMPPWAPALGEDGVTEVTEYVMQISGQEAEATQAAAGQGKYMMFCVACHGPEGEGNPALGAPNLTDGVWLYGGDREAIVEGLQQGRYGAMPAFGESLSEDRQHLLAAYVLSLSGASSSTSISD